jgi:hypothetical protein
MDGERTVAEHEMGLKHSGFSREELAEPAAIQQRKKAAPSKEEILAAIDAAASNNFNTDREIGYIGARDAVEKLFADRGL